MIIALVRHGETELNRQRRWQGHTDAPLNDHGRQQAITAATRLQGRVWSRMITSPLLRARTTAQLIADRLPEMPLLTDRRIVEQDFGAADGMPSAEATRRWPDGRFPGMETWEQVQQRGEQALEAIASEALGDVIVVCHGRFIRATIEHLCRMEVPLILNGAVCLIEHTSDGWTPIELNLVE